MTVAPGLDVTYRVEVSRACAEAEMWGTSLVAVHAWHPPMGDERLVACADRHPGVRVERHVVHGAAVHRLVEFADGASLIVVRLHGTGGLAGEAALLDERIENAGWTRARGGEDTEVPSPPRCRHRSQVFALTSGSSAHQRARPQTAPEAVAASTTRTIAYTTW